MFRPDIKLLPEMPRFSICDPADMMPAYAHSSLSPAQQEQLDAFKFQTIKSDYEYFRDNPVVGHVVGYIFERVLFDHPINIKEYLFELFKQPDIETKLSEYGKNKKCQQNCPPNIEEVMDLGYQIVEEPNIDPCGTAHEEPTANFCGTPHLEQRLCDDRMLARERLVMEHMKELYGHRDTMLPSYNTNLDVACDKYIKDGHKDAGFIGAPQEIPMYGGDYIFLRNTRCGRSIAQYIGDIDEIPSRPWPHDPEPTIGSALSFFNVVEIDGDLFTTTEREISEEEIVKDEMEIEQNSASIMRSQGSSAKLRMYFESDKNNREYELESVLDRYLKIDDGSSRNSESINSLSRKYVKQNKRKKRNIELEISSYKLSQTNSSSDTDHKNPNSDESIDFSDSNK